MAELKDGPRLSAEDQIQLARTGQVATASERIPPAAPLPSNVIPFPFGTGRASRRTPMDPKTTLRATTEEGERAAIPLPERKPSIGLEPMTPSLPWKCSTN